MWLGLAGGIGYAVAISTHTAELMKDIDHVSVAALQGSCQICNNVVFIESSFLGLRYVLVQVIRGIRVG